MLDRFVKWFMGYLYIRISGNSPERFINLCHTRGILLWNIKKTPKGYDFMLQIQEFKKLPSVARKTKTRPYIVKRIGFPFYVKRIRQRKGLLAGTALFFVLIYVLSAFIWDIQISGQYTHTEEALLRYLKTIEVYSGMRKNTLSCPEVETAIREAYSDIGWVSAELKGSKLLIKIQETNMPTLSETETKPMHLTASRDGIVESIVTRTGTPMVKAGDIVKKGDILISGIVEIYGDSGELLKKTAVCADGDVMVQSQSSYYNELLKQCQKKEYQNTDSITYRVSIFSYQIQQLYSFQDLLKSLKAINGQKASCGYDTLTEKIEIYLGNTLKLPIEIEKKTKKTYEYRKTEYSKEEMETILQEKFDHYIEKLTQKGVIIGENHVKIVIGEALGTISGKFVIFEKADKLQSISEDEWRMEKVNEYSGDSN